MAPHRKTCYLGHDVKLSIIVPAFNEEKLLPKALAHIQKARQSLPDMGWESELIVCDNNSSDRTAEIARAGGAQVVFEPINQIGRARNTGAAQATGDWLLFIDADSFPSPELFTTLVKHLNPDKYIALGCRVQMDESLLWFWNFWVAAWNTLSRLLGWAAGSFICCQAKAFVQVGGFDTRFFASEEVHLCKALKKLGRQSGRRIHILKTPPLLTSARKIRLYSGRELFRLMSTSLLNPKKFVADPDRCHIWYDGRR